MEAWLPRELWEEINLVWVGLGQELQMEKKKLILKALKSSDPPFALSLLKKLGVDVKKSAEKYDIDLSQVGQ